MSDQDETIAGGLFDGLKIQVSPWLPPGCVVLVSPLGYANIFAHLKTGAMFKIDEPLPSRYTFAERWTMPAIDPRMAILPNYGPTGWDRVFEEIKELRAACLRRIAGYAADALEAALRPR